MITHVCYDWAWITMLPFYLIFVRQLWHLITLILCWGLYDTCSFNKRGSDHVGKSRTIFFVDPFSSSTIRFLFFCQINIVLQVAVWTKVHFQVVTVTIILWTLLWIISTTDYRYPLFVSTTVATPFQVLAAAKYYITQYDVCSFEIPSLHELSSGGSFLNRKISMNPLARNIPLSKAIRTVVSLMLRSDPIATNLAGQFPSGPLRVCCSKWLVFTRLAPANDPTADFG